MRAYNKRNRPKHITKLKYTYLAGKYRSIQRDMFIKTNHITHFRKPVLFPVLF